MDSKTFDQTLPCKLNQEELNLKTDNMVRNMATYDNVEADMKAASADFKAKLKKIDEEVRTAARQIAAKEEERPVRCEERPDVRRNLFQTYRLDTGELVSERVMTGDEIAGFRQPKLFAIDGAGEGAVVKRVANSDVSSDDVSAAADDEDDDSDDDVNISDPASMIGEGDEDDDDAGL